MDFDSMENAIKIWYGTVDSAIDVVIGGTFDNAGL
jgi:hypothetical protein